MDTTQATPLLHSASSNTVPGYLLPLSQILFGASAISRSTPLNIFAIAFGMYWLFILAVNKPEGQYTHVYTAGCSLISVVLKTISAKWLMKDSEFERRDKKKDDDEKENTKTQTKSRSWWQWMGDVIEIGFMSARGIGW